MSKRFNQFLIHFIGCAVFLALPVLFSPDLSSDLRFLTIHGFQRDFLFSVLLVLYFYLSYFFLIPDLFFKKKYVLFFVLNILVFSLIFFIIIKTFPSEDFHPGPPGFCPPDSPPPHPFGGFVLHELRKFLVQFFIVFIFALMLRINNRWKKAEKEKLNADLPTLKLRSILIFYLTPSIVFMPWQLKNQITLQLRL